MLPESEMDKGAIPYERIEKAPVPINGAQPVYLFLDLSLAHNNLSPHVVFLVLSERVITPDGDTWL
jgi:hypothetical protein